MAQALLSTAKPVRLTRNEDGWALDVEQLVRVESSLFRPTVTTVWGREVILFHLNSNQSTARLAANALNLIEELEARGTREISFRPVNDSWVPSDLVDAAVNAKQAKENSREIRRLEQEVNTLTTRLRQMEDLMRTMKRDMESGNFVSAAPAGDVPAEPAAPRRDPDVEPASLPIPEAEKQAEPELSADEEAALAAELGPHITPPPVKEIASNVRMLLGDTVSCKKGKRSDAMSFPGDEDGAYMCTLIDDEDEVIGVMVADLTCTVRFGGALMMVPDGELDQQLAKMNPSEEVIEAMSEVFNTLSGAINLVDGNPHIRTTPLEPFALRKVPFAENPFKRADFEDSFGGRFAILSI